MSGAGAPAPWAGLNLSPLSWLERTGISSYVGYLLKAFRAEPERYAALSFFLHSRRKSAGAEVEALAGRTVRASKLPEKALFRLSGLPGWRAAGMSGLSVYHETSLYPGPCPRSCAMIYTLYDVLPLLHPDWYSPFSVREYRAAFKRASKTAARIIVQSKAAEKDVLEAAPHLEDKIINIPNGVDLERFRPDILEGEVDAALSALGLKRPYILFTGAIQPRKNVNGLVRAFRRLIVDAPHTLVLAGPVGWRGEETLAEIAGSSLSERVKRLGFVPEERLPALYRGADLYAFPSRGEGFGLTVLEAMACGVPVVASSVSAMPEVAGGAALLVHPDDDLGLAAAMRRILEAKGFRAFLIDKGLARAREYPWSRTADLTWSLYRNLKEQA